MAVVHGMLTLKSADINYGHSELCFEAYGRDRSREALVQASVRACGVLVPLVVHRRGDAWQLVDGRVRLAALQDDAADLPAIALEETLSALHLVLAIGALRAGELRCAVDQARFVAFAAALGVGDADLVERLLPLLGIGEHPRLVRRCLAVTALPEAVLRFCAAKQFSMKQCVRLTQHSAELLHLLFAQADNLALSASIVEELAEGFTQLIRVRESTAAQLFSDPEVQALLTAPGTPHSRVQALRDWLRVEVFPQLSRINAELQAVCADLAVDSRVQLQWDRTLENREVRASFVARTPEEWRQVVRSLQADGVDQGVHRLLELL